MRKHIFALCAYKESPYLEDCIQSLKNQTVKSDIILVTQTPNEYIKKLCDKYHIPMIINEGKPDMIQNWNFAYEQADAEFVTIVHQDDVYGKNYAEYALNMLEKKKQPIIFFSDYGEIRDGINVKKNRLLLIKRIMLFPLRSRLLQNSIFVRRRILSLGSPICCPSVTFVKENCPPIVFQQGFKADVDWEAWEMLSKKSGSFVYCNQLLVYHRIHEESGTSIVLKDNVRTKEDLVMFQKFWPKSIARILAKIYAQSEKSNNM